MGGGGTTTQQSAKNEPWAPMQPYLLDLLSRAQAESNTTKTMYPGMSTPDYSPQTVAAINALQAAGNTTLPTTQAAQDQMMATLGGAYLNNNPYLQQITSNISQDVGANLGDQFAASGGYKGSPGEVQAITREVARAAAPYYFQSYESERGRQANAAQLAPVFEAIQSGDLQKLMQAGGMVDTKNEQALQDAIQRWNFEQNKNQQQLQAYASLFQPAGAGTFGSQQGTTKSSQDMTGTYVGAGTTAVATAAMVAAIVL